MVFDLVVSAKIVKKWYLTKKGAPVAILTFLGGGPLGRGGPTQPEDSIYMGRGPTQPENFTYRLSKINAFRAQGAVKNCKLTSIALKAW